MIVHLVDGTYELFRQFYGRLRFRKDDESPLSAVGGVLHSILEMIETGATHVGVATDHVIESFRNRLWAGYKTGDGIDPALLAQFHPLEEALVAMGVAVWPMTELEADDALASAARIASAVNAVEKICIWTPDKDLAQCVRGDRIVQVDRKAKTIRNAEGVREKFGVEPALIPDFLALVGDAADGIPGLPGFGERTASIVLARYGDLDHIPERASDWDVVVRGKERLAETLHARRSDADLYRKLATLSTDAPFATSLSDLRFAGVPRARFAAWCAETGVRELADRPVRWA